MVYDVNYMTEGIKMKMKSYDVRSVPTTIIDGKIKIVGESQTFLGYVVKLVAK
jgi:predicted DsbA family dithiol-disulfide isomerase